MRTCSQTRHPRHRQSQRGGSPPCVPQLQDAARRALHEHSEISLPSAKGIEPKYYENIHDAIADSGGEQEGDHLRQPRRLHLIPAPQLQKGGGWQGY